MKPDKPPVVCPRCHSLRTVRLIWNRAYLRGEDESDVKAGLAISVNLLTGQSYEPWQALMRHRTVELPQWACLDCTPGWTDVQRLTMQDSRRQMMKEDAIVSMQFDRAAAVRDAQYRERDRLVAAVARLLGEADPTEREPV